MIPKFQLHKKCFIVTFYIALTQKNTYLIFDYNSFIILLKQTIQCVLLRLYLVKTLLKDSAEKKIIFYLLKLVYN